MSRQLADASCNLFPGCGQRQPALFQVLKPVQDELRLVGMQFPDLQRHDPSLAVGENGEWKDLFHAKSSHRIEAVLLADQQRIIHVHIECVP